MATYFMDLCFDAFNVYQYAFGKAPEQNEAWVIAKND